MSFIVRARVLEQLRVRLLVERAHQEDVVATRRAVLHALRRRRERERREVGGRDLRADRDEHVARREPDPRVGVLRSAPAGTPPPATRRSPCRRDPLVLDRPALLLEVRDRRACAPSSKFGIAGADSPVVSYDADDVQVLVAVLLPAPRQLAAPSDRAQLRARWQRRRPRRSTETLLRLVPPLCAREPVPLESLSSQSRADPFGLTRRAIQPSRGGVQPASSRGGHSSPASAVSSPRYDATSASRSASSSAVPSSTSLPADHHRGPRAVPQRHHRVLLDEQHRDAVRHLRQRARTRPA